MPYKFKSRATADLIMLEANGRQVLEIIGKSPDDEHGIITAEQIPAAIAALEAAAAEDAARRSAKPEDEEQPQEDEGAAANKDSVGLSRRVAPLWRCCAAVRQRARKSSGELNQRMPTKSPHRAGFVFQAGVDQSA